MCNNLKNIIFFCSLALAGAFPAAAQDKALHIYNWSDYIADDTLDKFTEATGIRVVYDVYDSNEVLEAKLMAGRTGYDIVVPTAGFLERQLAASLYQPLDKNKLPNLAKMDSDIMGNAAAHDPDNAHSVVYLWGTTGIGYNEKMVRERLGDEYEIDSWSLVFDLEVAAKVVDCGVAFLDAKTEMLPAALNYLGFDPNSHDKAELEKAADLLKVVRPHVRYFHSSQYINDLANGDICVARAFPR